MQVAEAVMAEPAEGLEDGIERLCRQEIAAAGQRYTPGLDSNAPNLRVNPLVSALDCVACGTEVHARLSDFIRKLKDNWERAEGSLQSAAEINTKISALAAFAASALPRLRARDESALASWKTELSAIGVQLEHETERWRAKLSEAPGEGSGKERTRYEVEGRIGQIQRCAGTIDSELEFCESAAGKALIQPFLLLDGEWGTGKTHFLCDETHRRLQVRSPVLLILAKSIRGGSDILSMISSRIDPGLTPGGLLDHLDQRGAREGTRAVIIIDGVNEGSREPWRRAISALCALVKARTHLALVVSCRTPLEELAISEVDLPSFVRITHFGFQDQTFDAQAAFFQYYGLSLPEVPLLDEEFSRPLTLKLICQSLKDLTGKKLAKGFSGIASGQRGMTFVLESFANRVGAAIEEKFKLERGKCWRLLKGGMKGLGPRTSGFAPNMAASMREYVSVNAAHRILAAHFPKAKRSWRLELLDELRVSGLLDENTVWRRSRGKVVARQVYQLPYQRFSDHLIARHLLEIYLDTSSEAAVLQCFKAGEPLGRIFKRRKNAWTFAFRGWAQAIIAEFPERVKNLVASQTRELFFYLPESRGALSAYFAPFVEGLFWRDPATFTIGTGRVVNKCLEGATRDGWNRLIDALLAIATKPNHPFHSGKLYGYLSGMSMPDRDWQWTEYLRAHYGSPTVRRLLAWAEQLNAAEMSMESAKELLVVFSLLLSTVVRKDRDIATKALMQIGVIHSRALFEHVMQTLEFNDPYVSERVLAAAYGVVMSNVDGAGSATFRPHLGWVARQLFNKMFRPGAPYATAHILRRDYALGIIGLARRAGCFNPSAAAARYLRRPFRQIPSPFRDLSAPSTEAMEATKHVIHMDFGNYTIGRLVPNRNNYDDKNPVYKRLRAQIEQRIYELGYRQELFAKIDNSIAGRPPYDGDRGKVDRYGKKYSWIAYFEMYGLREAAGELSETKLEERCSDADIDPSFPRTPRSWNAPMPDLFGDTSQSSDGWVAGDFTPDFSSLLVVNEINEAQGPWILLEGFVHADRKNLDREIFTFLRGLLVSGDDVARLRRMFLSAEYPGNHAIPDGGDEYYLYAGEAGRSNRFASELLAPGGRYRRQMRDAFERTVQVKTRKRTEPTKIGIKVGGTDTEFSIGADSRYRRIPGVSIELPARGFAWESYHSPLNDFSGFDFLAPSIIQRLELSTRDREIDFRDSEGCLASIYRQSPGDSRNRNYFKTLYVRRDLLERYLRKTRQELVWCNWGERGWAESKTSIQANPNKLGILQGHQHIHRRFHEWDVLRR